MGGSMGSVMGERFCLAADHAERNGVPLISVTASGGARMQENILALMQMAKTVGAVDGLQRPIGAAGQSLANDLLDARRTYHNTWLDGLSARLDHAVAYAGLLLQGETEPMARQQLISSAPAVGDRR